MPYPFFLTVTTVTVTNTLGRSVIFNEKACDYLLPKNTEEGKDSTK